jgi:quinohemoprotein ethanol dehydrogenase
MGARGGGVIKDLRHMDAATHQVFKAIVLQGARESLGMGNFSDVLSEADADAVHAYLIQRANQDWDVEHR